MKVIRRKFSWTYTGVKHTFQRDESIVLKVGKKVFLCVVKRCEETDCDDCMLIDRHGRCCSMAYEMEDHKVPAFVQVEEVLE